MWNIRQSLLMTCLDSGGQRSRLQQAIEVVCCGQGSSLLWTPALRPCSTQSIAPDQGGEENL